MACSRTCLCNDSKRLRLLRSRRKSRNIFFGVLVVFLFGDLSEIIQFFEFQRLTIASVAIVGVWLLFFDSFSYFIDTLLILY